MAIQKVDLSHWRGTLLDKSVDRIRVRLSDTDTPRQQILALIAEGLQQEEIVAKLNAAGANADRAGPTPG